MCSPRGHHYTSSALFKAMSVCWLCVIISLNLDHQNILQDIMLVYWYGNCFKGPSKIHILEESKPQDSGTWYSWHILDLINVEMPLPKWNTSCLSMYFLSVIKIYNTWWAFMDIGRNIYSFQFTTWMHILGKSGLSIEKSPELYKEL